MIGGTVHGLGASLTEEMVHDEDGQPTDRLAARLRAADRGRGAASCGPRSCESPSPRNPLGAKGIGEGGAIGTPAAIGNAIADALGGRRVDPPYTPEKLWSALR